MFDRIESLILDLLEWVAKGERNYDEVMAAWRMSCPRFPIWEDANDRGLVTKHHVDGHRVVGITSSVLLLKGPDAAIKVKPWQPRTSNGARRIGTCRKGSYAMK
jgi:D-3-phosphoglycerate dehydrogenase